MVWSNEARSRLPVLCGIPAIGFDPAEFLFGGTPAEDFGGPAEFLICGTPTEDFGGPAEFCVGPPECLTGKGLLRFCRTCNIVSSISGPILISPPA